MVPLNSADLMSRRNPQWTLLTAILVITLVASSPGPVFAEVVSTSDIGKPVWTVIERLRDNGHRFAYSTSVLTADMTVQGVPGSSEPAAMVAELLAPYGLQVREVNGTFVINRSPPGTPPPAPTGRQAATTHAPAMEELIVSASHYELVRNTLDGGVFIGQGDMQRLPVLADDPMRAVQRIPGTASGGVSARPHVRGGEPQDTGIVLNGNRLLEPFHVRNFQSLFSTIDARAVDGIEVYTGNFPVRYGHQMGGLVIIDSIEPADELHTELGLSVFNTSVLSAGSVADTGLGWVASARRGNLDLIIDDKFGEPSYSDFFGHVEAALSDNSTLSANALIANNDVNILTEENPDEQERSDNDTRSVQFWVNWQQRWSDSLRSTTIASVNSFDEQRVEFVNDPEEIVANVNDGRSVDVTRFEQHWSWNPSNSHEVLFGAEYEILSGNYDYLGSADYFGAYRYFERPSHSVTRNIATEISGKAVSVYLSDQWKFSENSAARIGLRWDHQGYTRVGDRGQVSPRLGFAHSFGPRTEFRANVGRYYQAQGIHELQVEDGIRSFFRSQRTDSGVIGIKHRLANGMSLRGEIYLKRSDRLRPRFENVLDPLAVLAEFKPDRVRISPDKLTSRGVELSVASDVTEHANWWASYVWSQVDDRIDGRDVPRSWDQRHAAQVGLAWERGRWQVSVIAAGHSGWPRTNLLLRQSAQDEPVLTLTDRASSRYGSFATLDFRIRYRRPVRVGYLSFFFEVSNATNRLNPCCVDFEVETAASGPPRLEIERDYWLPWIPAAGVLWEF